MNHSLKSTLKESIPVLTLAAAITMAAGLALGYNEGFLSIFPGILIIIPSFNLMNGSITSVLSCRLSSALHMGLVRPKFHMTRTLKTNMTANYLMATISFFVFGIIAWFFNAALGTPVMGMWTFSLVILVAGLMTTLILSLMSIALSYLSYSRGFDPDNWVIPLITSMGDFIGIFLLFTIASIAI